MTVNRRGDDPVSLGRARAALARLDQLAAAHPELVDTSNPQNRARWEAAIQEDETMSPGKMTTFRLPEELVARLDSYAAEMSRETGLPVKRTDVVRMLLVYALQAQERRRHRMTTLRSVLNRDPPAKNYDEVKGMLAVWEELAPGQIVGPPRAAPTPQRRR